MRKHASKVLKGVPEYDTYPSQVLLCFSKTKLHNFMLIHFTCQIHLMLSEILLRHLGSIGFVSKGHGRNVDEKIIVHINVFYDHN